MANPIADQMIGQKVGAEHRLQISSFMMRCSEREGHRVILPESKGLRKQSFLGELHEEIQMKTSRYTEPQILAILRQAEGGVPVADLAGNMA